MPTASPANRSGFPHDEHRFCEISGFGRSADRCHHRRQRLSRVSSGRSIRCGWLQRATPGADAGSGFQRPTFRPQLSDSPRILDGVDVLVHCAYDLSLTRRSDIWQTNVFGTTALLDRAVSAGVRRTIVLSSMSAYRGTRQLYGRAKLDTEIAALSRGMCAVRPGLVYGPGWGGMAGTLRRLAGLPVLPDFGSRAHQFTVREDDFAAAVLALARAEDSASLPVGVAHPDPVPFTELLAGFAASRGQARASLRPDSADGRLLEHYGPPNYFPFNYRCELTLSSGWSDRRRMCRILRSSRSSASLCSHLPFGAGEIPGDASYGLLVWGSRGSSPLQSRCVCLQNRSDSRAPYRGGGVALFSLLSSQTATR